MPHSRFSTTLLRHSNSFQNKPIVMKKTSGMDTSVTKELKYVVLETQSTLAICTESNTHYSSVPTTRLHRTCITSKLVNSKLDMKEAVSAGNVIFKFTDSAEKI